MICDDVVNVMYGVVGEMDECMMIEKDDGSGFVLFDV